MDEFQCCVRVSKKHGDALNSWPSTARIASEAIIARWLADHPGFVVIGDTSACVPSDDKTFPFLLVRTVQVQPCQCP